VAYRFGPFRVDPHAEQLWRGDRPVRLNRKAVQLLVTLLEHHGEIVSKQQLLSAVWPARGATLNNLSQHMFMLRSALEDTAGSHRYVLTVPSVGYRFVAPLERGEAESAERILARSYCGVAREFFEHRTPASIERAIGLYERALQYDARCGDAHVGLAVCRLMLADYLFEAPREMLTRAEEHALRALEIESGNPRALAVRARAASHLRFRWSEAEALLLDAFRSRPEYLWAHVHLVEHYAARGRMAHARQALAHARSLRVPDEAYPRLPLLQGLLDYFERNFEAAQAQLESLIEAHPDYAFAHFLLAKTTLAQGRHERAIVHAQHAAAIDFDPLRPGQPNVRRRALSVAVLAHAGAGNADGMRSAAAALDAQGAALAPSSFCEAIVALAHGRLTRALRAMEAAIANRESMASFVAVEPLLEPLHALAGWRSLLRAMNLAAS
jgi:DNA-binding winged helix-turn-helix (wHTH) protein/tetratricopeptide (TPR) repeat protein